MADAKPKGPAALVRTIVLLALLGVGGWFIWRNATRSEGYTGGAIVTTGTVEGVHVELSFKVPGRLASVDVAEGAVVSAGQPVARLETQDLDVALATARASLEAARAALAETRANGARLEHDLARQLTLAKTGANTQQQVDDAQSAVNVNTAQQQARVAQIHQAESAVSLAVLQRSYTDLRAPIAGLVSEKVHEPGEMVSAGTPVVILSEVDTVKVHAAVDETRVGAVRPGDVVRVRVYTFDRRWFEGRVSDIQSSGDFATRKDWGAQRRDIRTFSVTARVPNPDHLLKDGMTAEVTILAAPPAATAK
jgi:HlyD family secretion protein